MAALIRHGMQKEREINKCGNIMMIMTRNKHYKPSYKMPWNIKKKTPRTSIKFNCTEESIAAKGFNRYQREYTPLQDTAERVHSICESAFGSSDIGTKLLNPDIKFKILNACFKEFQHGVPNGLLSTVKTIDDVVAFYKTPIMKTSPIDAITKLKLPENLHIQSEAVRFHPETDTMFGGQTAFPGRSNIVTGLKYKKKYKGFVTKPPWPGEL